MPIDRHDGGISIRRKGIPFVVHDGPVVVWQAEMVIDGVGELTEVFFWFFYNILPQDFYVFVALSMKYCFDN